MMWNANAIRDLVENLRGHGGDSTYIEVKRALNGLPVSASSTVCAFANMPDGGTIILGIDERSGFTITGVDDPAAIEAALVHQARTTISPTPHLTTHGVDVDGRWVVVAEVSPLPFQEMPARVAGRAYLRQADGDYVMQEHELRMIEVNKSLLWEQQNYDLQVVENHTSDDLVPSLVEHYVAAVRARDRRIRGRTDADILRLTGITDRHGSLTLAGLYCLGDYPQGAFPSLTVTAAVQVHESSSGVRNRDLQHFRGPIPYLLDDLMSWCGRNVPLVRAYQENGHMEERSELPLPAIREFVANALVHRDLGPNTLGTGKSIQVRLTQRNLMILSPGGLHGVSLQQLESEDHAQAAVNQRVYSVAQKLVTPDGNPIIEGEGGGIREAFRAASKSGLPRPTLVNTGVQFKALLWRMDSTLRVVPAPTSNSRVHDAVAHEATANETEWSPQAPPVPSRYIEPRDNVLKVRNALAHRGSASIAEIATDAELSHHQVRYALRKELECGRIKMLGQKGQKTTRYRLVGEK